MPIPPISEKLPHPEDTFVFPADSVVPDEPVLLADRRRHHRTHHHAARKKHGAVISEDRSLKLPPPLDLRLPTNRRAIRVYQDISQALQTFRRDNGGLNGVQAVKIANGILTSRSDYDPVDPAQILYRAVYELSGGRCLGALKFEGLYGALKQAGYGLIERRIENACSMDVGKTLMPDELIEPQPPNRPLDSRQRLVIPELEDPSYPSPPAPSTPALTNPAPTKGWEQTIEAPREHLPRLGVKAGEEALDLRGQPLLKELLRRARDGGLAAVEKTLRDILANVNDSRFPMVYGGPYPEMVAWYAKIIADSVRVFAEGDPNYVKKTVEGKINPVLEKRIRALSIHSSKDRTSCLSLKFISWIDSQIFQNVLRRVDLPPGLSCDQ